MESKNNIKYKYIMADSIVEEVVNKIKSRSDIGIKKYGKTLDREDMTTIEWIDAAIEEQMDNILYLTRLKKDLSKK
jgi:histidinol dehydrogenase